MVNSRWEAGVVLFTCAFYSYTFLYLFFRCFLSLYITAQVSFSNMLFAFCLVTLAAIACYNMDAAGISRHSKAVLQKHENAVRHVLLDLLLGIGRPPTCSLRESHDVLASRLAGKILVGSIIQRALAGTSGVNVSSASQWLLPAQCSLAGP